MRKVVTTFDRPFGIPEVLALKLGIDETKEFSTNEQLIDFVQHPEKYEKMLAYYAHAYKIVEIPSEATDWAHVMLDDDAAVVYVLDGKLNFVFPEE